MAERISFKVPKETAKKLQEKANKKRKNSSTQMSEVLNRDSQQKNIDNAIELYKAGQVTGWKSRLFSRHIIVEVL